MAETVSLGDLLIRISGNVDGLNASAKQATTALDSMNAGGNKLVAGMTTTTAVVAGLFIGLAKTVDAALSTIVDKFVETGKTAQQLGLPVEELSKLQYAAKKAGVSTGELTEGIKDFVKAAGEVRSGIEPADRFVQSLNSIGISFKQLQTSRPTDLLLEIADRFSRMEDGVRKTRIAVDLFGRSGTEMIAFLNQGRAGITAYMDQLQATGNVLDKETTQKALKFKIAMDSIGGSFDAIMKKLTAEFLPVMETLATSFNSAIKSSEAMKLATDGLRLVFLGLANAATLAGAAIKATLESMGGMLETVRKLLAGDFKGAWDAYTNAWKQSFTTLKDGLVGVKDQWVASGLLAGGWATSVSTATEEVQKDLKALELTARQVAEQHALARKNLLESLVLTPGPTVFAIQEIERAMKAGRITLDEYTQAMDQALGNERRFQLLQLDDVMTKTSASMQEKLDALREALRRGTISWSTYGRNVREIEQQNRDQMLDTATMAASTISAVFKNNKGASIASALINTAVGITKALAQGGIWGWAQAGLIAAAGAAQVAAISSTNEDGSGGGSPSVSGQASAQQEAPQVQEQRTLFVQGFNKNEFFDGETAAGIARSLVQYQRDGGTVVIK